MTETELIDLIYKMCITKEELNYVIAHLDEWKKAYEYFRADHPDVGETANPPLPDTRQSK